MEGCNGGHRGGGGRENEGGAPSAVGCQRQACPIGVPAGAGSGGGRPCWLAAGVRLWWFCQGQDGWTPHQARPGWPHASRHACLKSGGARRRRAGLRAGRRPHAHPEPGAAVAAGRCGASSALSCCLTSSTTCAAVGLHSAGRDGTARERGASVLLPRRFGARRYGRACHNNHSAPTAHSHVRPCVQPQPAHPHAPPLPAPAPHLSAGSASQQRCMRAASAGGQSAGMSGRLPCWDTWMITCMAVSPGYSSLAVSISHTAQIGNSDGWDSAAVGGTDGGAVAARWRHPSLLLHTDSPSSPSDSRNTFRLGVAHLRPTCMHLQRCECFNECMHVWKNTCAAPRPSPHQ